MTAALVRAVVAGACGWGVWALWRSMRSDPTLSAIVGLGLAARALLGALLFWISYLGLPVGESLQLGNGIWFIALDGQTYFAYADQAASVGLGAILDLDPTLPSVVYIKLLALTMFVAGRVASAALLLNVVAYLATCAVIIRLADRAGAARWAKLFALGAASFMPSWILWATQPLKDTVFLALIALYALATFAWTTGVRAGGGLRLPLLTAWTAQWVVLYAIAGIRWYVAAMLLGATAVAGLVALAGVRSRRLVPAASAALLLVLLIQSVPVGAGPYLPDWGRDVLQPWVADRVVTALTEAPAHLVATVDRAREGGSRVAGATEIFLPGVSRERLRPQTKSERFFAGGVAMWVPRAIAQSAGWIQIGGGRGLWAFADLDTVLFSAVAIGALILTGVQWRRGSAPQPTFWLVLILTVVLGGGQAYEATNFGTLFRQRGMVMLGFVLMPVLMGPPAGRRTSGATTRA